MDRLSAQVLSTSDHAESDWRFFHELVCQVVDGQELEAVLAAVGDYLSLKDVVVCYPGDAPPLMRRAVVVSLFWRRRHLADLYADLPQDVESTPIAERLAVLVPVVALSLGTGNDSASPKTDSSAS